MTSSASLARGYASCREVTRSHAKSFFTASYALDPTRRRASFAVYAFCRRVDDAIDEADTRDPDALNARVTALREALDRVYSFAPLASDEQLALRDTVRAFGIERRPFDELIDGVARDVTFRRCESEHELDTYCYQVAGTVGLLMARVFGVRSDAALDHAIDLGKAMQLTNILRDVRDDLRTLDRVYLPRAWMDEHGVTEASLFEDHASPALRTLVSRISTWARALYRSADLGVPMITSATGRAATSAMRASYSAILDVIDARDGDVLMGRAVVPRGKRIGRAVRAALGSIV